MRRMNIDFLIALILWLLSRSLHRMHALRFTRHIDSIVEASRITNVVLIFLEIQL